MRYCSHAAGLFLITCFAINAPAASTLSPTCWVLSSLERTTPTATPGTTKTAELKAARNEYESFQIVVRGKTNALTNVNVAVSDLIGPTASISHANITLYREHFVHVTKSSPNLQGTNRPLGAGWYPDGLIPFVDPLSGSPIVGAQLSAAPFPVALNKDEAVWVDVYVPTGTPAGLYNGIVTVTSDQGTTKLPLNVTVWAFDLPSTPTLKSMFPLPLPDGMTLLSNKLMPMMIPSASARDFMQHGLGVTALWFSGGANGSNCTMSTPPTTSELLQAKSFFPSTLTTYVWSADEVTDCPAIFSTIRAWGQALHRAGVEHLVTMAPVPELLDDGLGAGHSAVDYWGLLPLTYDQHISTVLMAQAKGDEIWSYNALVQDPYSPKWQIDYLPINFRIQPGFISGALDLNGLLYWRLDNWSNDPWNEVNQIDEWGDNYPGDGMLVYPGSNVGISGVAPSMRLKQIRDGVEDYDYIQLLRRSGELNLLSSLVGSVATDWHTWTQNAATLEAAREAIGTELDRRGRLAETANRGAQEATNSTSRAGTLR